MFFKRFITFPEKLYVHLAKNNKYTFPFILLSIGHILLTFVEVLRVPSEETAALPVWVNAVVYLLIPLFLMLKLLLEAGYLWIVLKFIRRLKYQELWLLICINAIILLAGEWVNQVLLFLLEKNSASDPFALVKIGLNMVTSQDKVGIPAYLILSEMTPFALWSVIFLSKMLKKHISILGPYAFWTAISLWASKTGLSVAISLIAQFRSGTV